MPPQEAPVAAKSKKARIWAAIGIIVIVLIAAIGFILITSPDKLTHTHLDLSNTALILSLDTPIQDKEGIPYSGTVLYRPGSHSYSYLATANEGRVVPLGSTAFSSGPYYLATQASATSTNLVLYNSSTLSRVRVIKQVAALGSVISSAWAQDGRTFAYVVADTSSTPSLTVEDVSGKESKKLAFGLPLGFSPGGSKILVRGTPTLGMIDIASGKRASVSGVAFQNPQTELVLSPSGTYLIAVSGKQIDWYSVRWDIGTIASLGKTILPSPISDAVFGPDDSLLVRQKGSDIARRYSVESGAVKQVGAGTLLLPESAHILHIESL